VSEWWGDTAPDVDPLASRATGTITPERLGRSARLFALCVAVVVTLASLTVLIGWTTDTGPLTRLAPSEHTHIVPWAAVLLILLAVALAARVFERSSIAIGATVLMFGIGLAVTIAGDQSSLARALFPDSLDMVHLAGGPLVAGFVVMTAIGVSLIAEPPPRIARWTVGVVDLAVLVAGGAALCWSAYGAAEGPALPDSSRVSVPVIVMLVGLAVARLALRPDVPPVSILRRQTLGGALSRGILSTLIAAPFVVGILVVAAPERGWWGLEAGAVALVVMTLVAVLAGAVLVARFSDDVTAALAESEARFRLALENAPIGIALVGTEGSWLHVNPALTQMFGYSEDELRELTWQQITHPEDVAVDQALVDQTLAGEIEHYSMEKRYLRADGRVIWGLLTVGLVRDPAGEPRYFISQIEDVTERHAADARLRALALHDSLTDLPNRNLLIGRLDELLAHPGAKASVAVLYLDLDRFKVVNDSLGHLAGDELLRLVAQRIATVTRPGDTVARLGGDEFAVVCTELDSLDTAIAIAQRLLDGVSEPLIVAGREVVTTASIGIAMARPNDTSETLLRNADVAMYQAKQRGRQRLEVFSDTLGAIAHSRFELETAIRHALRADQFVVHYQTQHAIGTGEVVGVEALVRWQHPERGLLPPDAFLPIAEEVGLIAAVGARVLDRALDECATWLASASLPLGLAVNLAPAQLADPTFEPVLFEMLERFSIPPQQLCLEMTETSLFTTTGGAAEALHRLDAAGICIAADDFGTGYASLAVLTQLPVTLLKIDHSFTAAIMDPASNHRAVVEAIIGLGRQLDIAVIAEGIETADQADLLLDLGCMYAQGFHFSRPMAAPDFRAAMSSR
jgi:diguanylate cyclase (GGDEF)-like protein/PAS domain S-box-containing protein